MARLGTDGMMRLDEMWCGRHGWVRLGYVECGTARQAVRGEAGEA